MGLIQILSHLLDFTAPAAFVATIIALCAHRVLPGARSLPGVGRLAGIGFVSGVLVLVAGLAVFGRDGKMVTYGAMVVVMATVPWLLGRGWRG